MWDKGKSFFWVPKSITWRCSYTDWPLHHGAFPGDSVLWAKGVKNVTHLAPHNSKKTQRTKKWTKTNLPKVTVFVLCRVKSVSVANSVCCLPAGGSNPWLLYWNTIHAFYLLTPIQKKTVKLLNCIKGNITFSPICFCWCWMIQKEPLRILGSV